MKLISSNIIKKIDNIVALNTNWSKAKNPKIGGTICKKLIELKWDNFDGYDFKKWLLTLNCFQIYELEELYKKAHENS